MAKLEYPSSESNSGTSRRALLRGLAVAPVVASTIASPWSDALAALHRRYEDEPAKLVRTKEGRSISRFRYHNAERRWMLTDIVAFPGSRFTNPALHFAGFVCQQALCAYLLDVGFADEWNAQHISLSYSRRSVSGPLWAFAAAGCIARTTGIAGVCFTAFGLMGFSG